MKKTLIAACAAMVLGAAVAEEPMPPKSIFGETEAQKAQRMAWWTHGRFGMFIHFGLYAVPGRHEWVKSREAMTSEEYDGKYLSRFNPDLYDAKRWARAAKAAGRGEYGRVTVGFAGASSHEALPLLTRAVRAAHPGLELVMRGETYANEALAKVADGSLDLGFVRLPITQPGVQARVIEVEELICALPSDHRLAERESIPVEELRDEPFVSFPANAGSTLRDATVKACVSAGFTPRVVQEAPDSYTILALVAAGVGVTLTLTSCKHIQQTGLVYRPLAGEPTKLYAALAWRPDNTSAALRTVLEIAEEALPTPDLSAEELERVNALS